MIQGLKLSTNVLTLKLLFRDKFTNKFMNKKLIEQLLVFSYVVDHERCGSVKTCYIKAKTCYIKLKPAI